MQTELAAAQEMKLVHEYEVVWLKAGSREIIVGDHYGDPAGGIIDTSHGWCLSFGEGVILYWFKQPFEKYSRGRNSGQWLEWGREKDIRAIISARQISPFKVEIVSDHQGLKAKHTLEFCEAKGSIVEV